MSGQLGAARVAEHVPHALGAEHLQEHVASEAHGRAPYRWLVDWSGPRNRHPDGPDTPPSTPRSASSPYSC